MKKFFTLMIIVFFTITIWAQTPQKMSYQSVIRNGGALVTGTSVPMVINIWRDAVTSGTLVYTESLTPSTNGNGVVSIEIGGGTGFDTISWARGSYYIETITDLTGIGGTNVTGSSQLLSVPYALSTAGHYIGELYGGGIVVAVWKKSDVEHGLIASLADIGGLSAWSNLTTLIGPTAQSLTDGLTNSNNIIAQAGHTGSAAQLCRSYTGGGFNDWYLPAYWELLQCYSSALIVNTILSTANGFKLLNYWSSTEAAGGGANAWFKVFDVGTTNYGNKTTTYSVRAVRKF